MITKDLYTSLLPLISRYDRAQIAILTDRHLLGQVQALCAQISIDCPTLALDIDEAHKSIESVQAIWDFLFADNITRRGLLICIGGGVLTDIGGFAASTFKRGIDYLNIPTTLLAMVDASSGGKTGINYGGLKNSIGVFAEPVETLIWPEWLRTLPPHEFLSGFGEMLKTGLLDAKLWPQLLQYDLDTMPIDSLTPLIEACVETKRRIVASDPHEQNLRKALNLGHTFGHALEEISIVNRQSSIVNRQSSNRQFPHGYAVVYGLIAELYLSITKLDCPREPLQQLTQLMLHHYGRPQCNCSDREQLIALMHRDKKNERAADINCTLIRDIGEPAINRLISDAEASEALEYLFSL